MPWALVTAIIANTEPEPSLLYWWETTTSKKNVLVYVSVALEAEENKMTAVGNFS